MCYTFFFDALPAESSHLIGVEGVGFYSQSRFSVVHMLHFQANQATAPANHGNYSVSTFIKDFE